MRLFLEAEKIRDDLLQESFSIRRQLEILPTDNLELLINQRQEYLTKMQKWHQSLAKLSDRLFPESLQEHLPLAIYCLLEQWQISHPDLDLEIILPNSWRREKIDNSLTILMILDELLKVTLPEPEVCLPISIFIHLQQHHNTAHLQITITYPNSFIFISYYNLTYLSYLQKIFHFFTLGKCFFNRKNLTLNCNFYW
ncbi:hypothetical protein [Calothrix sp. UHCC 0171]|uniref:hypothetical protein n=1 Tax=Calothrix sp. UHCC 0171 TaxID=3110245 RepID=UPI002B2089BE|nr:hypothetical protein [Calothrix sp. UHCC 0171]MEA5570794.1 hypothetical protein [Calothrix sp. UHCC 0171]